MKTLRHVIIQKFIQLQKEKKITSKKRQILGGNGFDATNIKVYPKINIMNCAFF